MIKLLKTIPAFPVKKIDKAVAFYNTKLGFACRHKEDGFAILVCDGIEIHLWEACDKSWKWRSLFLFLKPIWSGAESFLAGTHSCRIEVQGIDTLYKGLKEKKVLYSDKTVIEKTHYGTKEFNALDLHRNLLTFYENIEQKRD